MNEPIHIISLGAGVQSSTMALMAMHGEITPMPAAAIFADTQDESPQTYDWILTLEETLPFPLYTVCDGHLSEDFLRALRDNEKRCGQPPYFTKNGFAQPEGKLRRKCTDEYKKAPVRRKAKEIMLAAGYERIKQWIGISLDEADRMRDSDRKYIELRYPLIDLRMTVHDCKLWLQKHGYPIPVKSACWHCPFAKDSRWRWMRERDPASWAKAVAYDKALREQPPGAVGITSEMYLHRSLKPLGEVDLSSEEDRGQLDMFRNDCSGYCGV